MWMTQEEEDTAKACDQTHKIFTFGTYTNFGWITLIGSKMARTLLPI